jgi:hypothetical protein
MVFPPPSLMANMMKLHNWGNVPENQPIVLILAILPSIITHEPDAEETGTYKFTFPLPHVYRRVAQELGCFRLSPN